MIDYNVLLAVFKKNASQLGERNRVYKTKKNLKCLRFSGTHDGRTISHETSFSSWHG
jgi:hypothetical protein